MYLERFQVRGFHSIRDLTIEPGDLSIFVGPNNAGKTNILGALGFLGDVYRSGLSKALYERGGTNRVFFRGSRDESLDLEFDVTVRISANELINPPISNHRDNSDHQSGSGSEFPVFLRHRFLVQVIGGPETNIQSVREEQIEIWTTSITERIPIVNVTMSGPLSMTVRLWKPSHPLLKDSVFLDLPFYGGREELTEFNDRQVVREFELPSMYDEPHRSELAFDRVRVFSRVLRVFSESIGSLTVYTPWPMRARQPTPPGYGLELGPEGQNLPTVVNRIQRLDPEAWSAILQSLFSISPSLDDVQTYLNEDQNLSLRFWELVGDDVQMRSAADMSDGTIRALSMLVAIFDPLMALVVIEEPENSLHPWAIRVIVEACHNASAQFGKQIILSTHSPVVLDAVDPDVVFVVWQDRNGTVAKQLTELDPQARELWAEGESTLSDLVDSGYVRQAIPGAVL